MPKLIELEVYRQQKSLASTGYRRTVRKLVLTLKHNEELRKTVIDGTLSVKDLVTKYKQDSSYFTVLEKKS